MEQTHHVHNYDAKIVRFITMTTKCLWYYYLIMSYYTFTTVVFSTNWPHFLLILWPLFKNWCSVHPVLSQFVMFITWWQNFGVMPFLSYEHDQSLLDAENSGFFSYFLFLMAYDITQHYIWSKNKKFFFTIFILTGFFLKSVKTLKIFSLKHIFFTLAVSYK